MMLVPLIAVVVIVVVCRRSMRRDRQRIVQAIRQPPTLAQSRLYACKTCGCQWRLWDDGLWMLAPGDQRPDECCRAENMTEVER